MNVKFVCSGQRNILFVCFSNECYVISVVKRFQRSQFNTGMDFSVLQNSLTAHKSQNVGGFFFFTFSEILKLTGQV